MNFLNQINTWWIVGAALLILIVQTVLFKLVLDRSHSSSVDDPEPAGADAATSTLPAAGEASFATGSRGNRPRRRKHLQQEAAVTVGGGSSHGGPESSVKPTGESHSPGWPEPGAPVEPPARPPISLTVRPQPTSSPGRAAGGETDIRPLASVSGGDSDIDKASPGKIEAKDHREETPAGAKTGSPALPELSPVPLLAEPVSLTAAPELSAPLATSTTAAPSEPDSHRSNRPISLPVLLPSLETGVTPPPPVAAPPADHLPIPMPSALREEAMPTHETPLVSTAEEPRPEPDAEPSFAVPTAPGENLPVSEAAAPEVMGSPTAGEAADHSSALHAPAMKEPSSVPEAAVMPTEPVVPPSKISPASPVIRRAVGPPRLFLTREFSSLRIRSRPLASTPTSSPAATEAAVIGEPSPEPVEAKTEASPEVAAVLSPAEEKEHSSEVIPQHVHAPAAETSSPTAHLVMIDQPVDPVEAAPEQPTAGLVEHPAVQAESLAQVDEIHSPSTTAEVETPIPSANLTQLRPTVPENKDAPPSAPAHEPSVETSVPKSVEMPPISEGPAPAVVPAPASEPEPVVDTVPEPAIIPPVPADLISLPPTATTHPTMPPMHTGTDERASAQITFSFEVSSLQLTPAFRLGSVQIRPLSNVVSLQLGAGHGPQPSANPLAANVSFEILSVQTGADSRIQSLVIRPLPQAQAATAPQPRLQVNAVQLTRGVENAPIQITPAQQTSTSVQVLATCTIAGIDFTPLFEIGSMRLEPNSHTVLLRLTSPQAGGADLPPVFEIASVQLGGDGQIAMVQLTPSSANA